LALDTFTQLPLEAPEGRARRAYDIVECRALVAAASLCFVHREIGISEDSFRSIVV
jgi:hypothetical protein